MRGSTIALTNAAGNVTDTWTYDTYGAVTNKTGRNAVLFQYNGRDGVATDENGLLYMRARYYSPQMKRFINADVLSGTISRSTTLNRYAYVEGNPISYVDPFGLSAEPGSNWVWNLISSMSGHDWLDGLGMLPGYGASFDAINAIWYLMEGDRFNAAFSAVSFIPVIGEVTGASKMAKKVSKYGGQASEIIAKYGDNVVRWADDIVESIRNAIRNMPLPSSKSYQLALPDGGSIGDTRTLGELIDSFKSWIKKAVPDGGSHASPNKIDNLLDGRPEFTGSTRDKLLATVKDPELSKIINELYRPGATVGDGGTAAILVEEFYNGSSKHLIKATERLKQLKDLESSGKLGLNDLDVVDALIDDLESAISLFD